MPYKSDISGIYRIINRAAGECYVGKSKGIKKRAREHFRLLRKGTHPNYRLQEAFTKHGESNFSWEVEVECYDPRDMVSLEEAFLQKEAFFLEPCTYNISITSHAPMTGRKHSEEHKERIRLGRRAATFDYKSTEYRATLSAAQMARFQSDPKNIEKLRFILENDHMSYAERARHLKSDTSSVRKMYLKYRHLKGAL